MTVGRRCRCCDVTPTGCDIYSDTFNSDSLESSWEQVAPTWAITGGKLRTSTPNALIVTEASGPSATSVQVTTKRTLPNLKTRIIIGYADANNYLFAEITHNSASQYTAGLYSRESGTDILLTTSIRNGLNYTERLWRLCFDGSLLILTDQSEGEVITSASASAPGNRAGLANSSVGTQEIDNFTWHRWRDDCRICQVCKACEGIYPTFFQVTIHSFIPVPPEYQVGGAEYCDNCEEYNGTYICTHKGSFPTFFGTSSFCLWEYEEEDPPCPHPSAVNPKLKVQVIIGEGTAPADNITVRVLRDGVTADHKAEITFGQVFGGPPLPTGAENCNDFNGLEILNTFFNPLVLYDRWCALSLGLFATVTALPDA